MDLTLTIIEAPENVNMLNHTKAFRAEGGSFGRSDNNNWVLPDNDRVVSSKHAEISFKDGSYYLIDRSTNGTFHNGNPAAIGPGQSVMLNNGDTLTVGDYKLKVSVKAQPKSPELPKGLQTADFLDSEDKTTFTAATQSHQEKLSQAKELDDWLDLESPAATSNPSQSWGSVSSPANAAVPTSNTDSFATAPVQPLTNDPLSAFGGSSETSTLQSSIDPLAALDQASNIAPPAPPAWEDEDDWWKDGSDSDHAPALSHAVNTPQQPTPPPPAFETTAPQVTPKQAQPMWDNQPHLQNISAADVNQVIGMESAPSTTQPVTPQHTTPPTQVLEQHKAFEQQQVFEQQISPPTGETTAYQQALPATGFNPADTGLLHNPAASPKGTAQQPYTPEHSAAPQHSNSPTPPHPQAISSGEQPSTIQTDPMQVTAPQPAVHPGATGSNPVELASALGLTGLEAQQLAQLVPEASAIINETVNRLIDLLRARSSIKNELRVQRTMIQTTDNNPLKFSASAPDAIKAMFSAENQAFMRPQDAIKDSFDDLSDHQVAVLAGMRAAYDAMFKHFNPDTLDKRFNNNSSLLSNKKAKNWEAFEEHYAMLQRDGEASYDLLFGETFATHYEKQLSELKTARSLTRSRN